MMLISFGLCSANDSSANFGSFLLFFSHKSIGMLNVIHVTFKFRITHFETQIFAKILFVIINIHTTTFEKQPQLSSAFVFQVIILFQFFVQVKHTRRKIFSIDCFDVFKVQFELTVKLSLFDSSICDTVNGLVHKGFQLVLNIIFQQSFSLNSSFEYFLS